MFIEGELWLDQAFQGVNEPSNGNLINVRIHTALLAHVRSALAFPVRMHAFDWHSNPLERQCWRTISIADLDDCNSDCL
jgi:hypothetical protein